MFRLPDPHVTPTVRAERRLRYAAKMVRARPETPINLRCRCLSADVVRCRTATTGTRIGVRRQGAVVYWGRGGNFGCGVQA
jgi:hypothetical protein